MESLPSGCRTETPVLIPFSVSSFRLALFIAGGDKPWTFMAFLLCPSALAGEPQLFRFLL